MQRPSRTPASIGNRNESPRADAGCTHGHFASGCTGQCALRVLIGGTDAHAKNYSLLLDGEQVRLAPLYDISSALPYPQLQKHKIKLAMKVGSHYRWWDITLRDWQATATAMRLAPAVAMEMLAGMALELPRVAEEQRLLLEDEGIEHPVLETLVQEIASSCQRCLSKFSSES